MSSIRILAVTLIVVSALPSWGADLPVRPKWGTPIGEPAGTCDPAARVHDQPSAMLPLTYSEKVSGSLTIRKFEFDEAFPPVEQTWVDSCHDNVKRPARDYTNLRFFMTNQVVAANPEEEFPVHAQLDFDFKAYVDPTEHELGGPTLYRIAFYNHDGSRLDVFGLDTAPEPNCRIPTPIHQSFQFDIPAGDMKFFEEITSFQVFPLPYDTTGYCA